jgi:hypothetical protein
VNLKATANSPGPNLTVIQLSAEPVFVTSMNNAVEARCPNCSSLLVVGPASLENLISVDLICYTCAQRSSSPSRTPGQPIPTDAVIVRKREVGISTVHMNQRIPLTGKDVYDQYVSENNAPALLNDIELSGEWFDNLIEKTQVFTRGGLASSIASLDRRSITHSPPDARERLAYCLVHLRRIFATTSPRRSGGLTFAMARVW